MKRIALIFTVLLGACAAPTEPTCSEFRIGDITVNWAASTGNVTKVLACENGTKTKAQLQVVCEVAVFLHGESAQDLTLDPGAHWQNLIDVPARYQVDRACHRGDWWPLPGVL